MDSKRASNWDHHPGDVWHHNPAFGPRRIYVVLFKRTDGGATADEMGDDDWDRESVPLIPASSFSERVTQPLIYDGIVMPTDI